MRISPYRETSSSGIPEAELHSIILCPLLPLDGIVTLKCVPPPSEDGLRTVLPQSRVLYIKETNVEKLRSHLELTWPKCIGPESHCGFETWLPLC